MLTVTETAANRVAELMQEETDVSALRIFVQGGGCSGMQYGFAWDNDQAEDDFVVESAQVKILVDSMSMQYLQGATVDYHEDFNGANFVIQNPNAQTSCGCGSSFSV